MQEITLKDIELLAEDLSSNRQMLASAVESFEGRLQVIRDELMPEIRTLAANAGAAWDVLAEAVADNPALFVRPKSQLFHNIKLGRKKQKGKTVIDDEALTIRRIRELVPEDQAELLIRQTEAVDKNAVADLTATDLKRLGIRIIADTEISFVRPVDTAIDKLVNALIKAATIDEEKAA